MWFQSLVICRLLRGPERILATAPWTPDAGRGAAPGRVLGQRPAGPRHSRADRADPTERTGLKNTPGVIPSFPARPVAACPLPLRSRAGPPVPPSGGLAEAPALPSTAPCSASLVQRLPSCRRALLPCATRVFMRERLSSSLGLGEAEVSQPRGTVLQQRAGPRRGSLCTTPHGGGHDLSPEY